MGVTNDNFFIGNSTGTAFEIDRSSGNIFIGTNGTSNSNFGAKLEVSEGDVYISQLNSGVILVSPNGNCWRVTISDTGTLISSSIICP